MSAVIENPRLDDRDFYAGDPHPTYEWMRREHPVYWYEQGGFWAVTKYADIRFMSRTPELFSSAQGVNVADLHPELGLPADELAQLRADGVSEAEIRGRACNGRNWQGGEQFLPSDPPRHRQLRQIVNKAFTPRTVATLHEQIAQLTKDRLDQLSPGATVNFIDSFAAPIPVHVIASLLGIPTDRWTDFQRWADAAVASADTVDPEGRAYVMSQKSELIAFFRQMLAERRAEPGEDLISRLLAAEVDGEYLSEMTVLMFCGTLLAAGSETTRQLITGAIKALHEHPEQRALLASRPEIFANALEEFLRWTTPVATFARTATQDLELGGKQIKKGDFLLMIYSSGNRDEEVWDNPYDLDLARPIDPAHLAFGFGEHVCLGANLARVESTIALQMFLQRFPDFEVVGEPGRLRSTNISGYTSMSVRLG